MYHLEIRAFPHNVNRFNLGERDLLDILVPWVRGERIELGEHRWSPETGRLIVLEGPQLELGELSLGRGWSTAERKSTDITERALAWAGEVVQAMSASEGAPAPAQEQQPVAAPAAPRPPAGAGDPSAAVADLLGARGGELLEAWRDVASRAPGLSPSEALALAERNIGLAGPAASGPAGAR